MNTDWNSPQGDFDTAEKQGELLMLLSRQQVTVHTWDDPDFDYMEEQDLALVVQSPSGTEDLLIELCGEFSVFFEKWHGEYAATALPAGSRLELVCWDPAQNRKVQLPEE